MRILAILYCYPPLLVPASICYLKLVVGLRRVGVDVEIVAITPESFRGPGGIDVSLLEVTPPDVVQHAIRSPESSLWMRGLKRIDRSRRFLCPILEPKKREWTVAAMRRLRRLDLSRYDVVLSCSQPHANHLLGLELKRRTQRPWVAYFSDPWSDNPYTTYPSERAARYNRGLEDTVLREADAVLFTSEEMLRFVAQNHPVLERRKAHVLPHAFVPEWYGPAPERPAGGPLRLLHTGHFYGPRTPRPLLDALLRLREAIDLDGRLAITSHGSVAPEHVDWIRAHGLQEVVRFPGNARYLESLALMRAHDVLLLIDAPLERAAESVFLPSKLIDYLGSQQPVIAITPRQGATARVVRDTGGIVCALEDPASIDDTLRELAVTGRAPSAPVAAATRAYACTQVAATFVEILKRV
jgi:glycosyltransferase involved in cell wall biosynthesis